MCMKNVSLVTLKRNTKVFKLFYSDGNLLSSIFFDHNAISQINLERFSCISPDQLADTYKEDIKFKQGYTYRGYIDHSCIKYISMGGFNAFASLSAAIGCAKELRYDNIDFAAISIYSFTIPKNTQVYKGIPMVYSEDCKHIGYASPTLINPKLVKTVR
jgi:hypothetical protein